MKNLTVSRLKGKKYSSSLTAFKPLKGTFSDITAINYDLGKRVIYSASIKIIHKSNQIFAQELKV